MTGGLLKVAVLGPGGVGGLLAAVLARGGNSVLVLASDETSSAIARDGLRLESVRFGNVEVSVRTATRLSESVDACLVTVKATQLRDAVARVPADALGDGLVIPFLNGLEHVDFLRSLYPRASIAPATIRVETVKVGAGVIRLVSPFVLIEIAAAANNRDRVEGMAAHMKAVGFDVRVRDDELAMLWDKFALLEPFALLTTHERANAGAIRARRRRDAEALIAEVVAVAETDGVTIDGDGILRLLDSMPETMESSMQRDQAAGRALELDALGGALMRRAARARVAVPTTTRLVEEIRGSGGRA